MAISTSTWERLSARGGISPRRARTYGFVFIGAGLLIYLLFARAAVPGQTSTFVLNFGTAGQTAPIPDLVLPTGPTLYALALVCAFFGGWQLARGFKRVNLVLGVIAGLFVLAFLAWASRGQSFNLTGMLNSALLRAVPIALAGLSGVICERCAVINIGIEGMMLTGAFTATLMGSLALNVWMWPSWASMSFGLICALISGALLGLLLAVLAVRFKVNQIIAGTAINILSVGVTSFLSSRILSHFQQLNNTGTMQPVPIPLLSQIPVIGPVVFEQNLLVYLLYVLLIVTHVVLFYTRWGLRTRAVGEHPRAADTLGINVFKIRYVNVTIGGMVAALGGAFLILGSVGRFDELMTAGKGFIGLAAMIFGKWMPFGAFGAALIFGFADALQTKLAILRVPIPSQFLLMAPYLATIVVLAGVVGEAVPPAADGQPYEKE
ncbi:MAG: ABC transporter permease [Anaerolineae bacterium]|nr:ABC transporter permease [Anaerolineae bacterium]MDW7991662.1 ABC transporter permease [Anaerolineae bacterium]